MDRAGIEQLLGLYFDASFERDGDKMSRAFRPEAHIYGLFEGGELTDTPRDSFVGRVAAAPETAAADRDDKIHLIEFSGPDTALAKVSLRVGPTRFTDLLTLARQDGEWKIVSKLFYGKPV